MCYRRFIVITILIVTGKQVDEWAIIILDKTGEIKAGIQDGREIIPVKRENDLIEIFLTRMEAIQPDILVGYNSDYFDIPYIYYRIKNRLGERTAKRLSPIRIVEERDCFPPPIVTGKQSLSSTIITN